MNDFTAEAAQLGQVALIPDSLGEQAMDRILAGIANVTLVVALVLGLVILWSVGTLPRQPPATFPPRSAGPAAPNGST